MPSGTVVECDPIKVDLLGGWKGCEIVETAVVEPGGVDRPTSDKVVQADPALTATAERVVEIDQAQPEGEEVVGSSSDPTPIATETPVPTEISAPTEVPGADTTALGAITDRPMGSEVLQPAPDPPSTPTPTPFEVE